MSPSSTPVVRVAYDFREKLEGSPRGASMLTAESTATIQIGPEQPIVTRKLDLRSITSLQEAKPIVAQDLTAWLNGVEMAMAQNALFIRGVHLVVNDEKVVATLDFQSEASNVSGFKMTIDGVDNIADAKRRARETLNTIIADVRAFAIGLRP